MFGVHVCVRVCLCVYLLKRVCERSVSVSLCMCVCLCVFVWKCVCVKRPSHPSLAFHAHVLRGNLCFEKISFFLTLIFKRNHGSISPKCLPEDFISADPNSAKRQSSHQCLFALLEYAGSNTARKMSTPY